MYFFDPSQPILQRKQPHLDIQDLRGLIRFRWEIRSWTLLSWLYTRIDQVFLLWGWITLVIFWLPHFFPSLSWSRHASFSSCLVLIGVITMTYLSTYWGKVEGLLWVVYTWSGLMLAGVVLTDMGVFGPNPFILMNLCSIWLGLSGLGYFLTGLGLRSRTFLLAAIFHGLAIGILSLVPQLQFFITGSVIAGTLFMLADVQWDMRPPRPSRMLSLEEQSFNQQQHQRRQQYFSDLRSRQST